ncbi:MAG: type II toxin-antitoxin system RatA family toxin [Methylococcaceae bacterium]|nr:type II toxin-antitoxin system RatA family toxin [Methylococcaceae bacterium]
MTQVKKSALVKVSAKRMFDLVKDIESYPEFLPWCSGSKIIKQEGDIVEAELKISKAGFNKSFSTRNRSVGNEKLFLTLLDGPFSSLDGVWNFLPLREDASKISLDLEFEINGRFAGLAFGVVFNQICNTMVSSFTDRAKQLYN